MQDLFIYGLSLCAVLTFASLSGLISERAGVINIAIEGMMTIGALTTSILGTFFNKDIQNIQNETQYLAIIVGGLIAGVFALLHAYPSITLKSKQVISGTALNILALGIAVFLASSGFFGTNPTSIISHYFPINIGSVFPVWLLIAIIVTIGIAIFFKFSKFGLRYTMVGENPYAVDAAGINVNKYRYVAIFCSGILAGLGGGVFITTIIGNGNFNGSVMGYGFLGMAIMIFGQWRIHYISIGIVLFSILFALGSRIGFVVEELSHSAIIFKIVPFALTLATMVIFKKSNAPLAIGQPFDKTMNR